MESSAPAGQAGPDLFFAWKLAMNIDVRAFPADYEQAARRRSATIHGLSGPAGGLRPRRDHPGRRIGCERHGRDRADDVRSHVTHPPV